MWGDRESIGSKEKETPQDNTNAHPLAFCAWCGGTKPVISWSDCSHLCEEMRKTHDRSSWALPDAPISEEKVGTL